MLDTGSIIFILVYFTFNVMQVRFLHEEAVIESVQTAVDAALLKCDSSRKFYTQVGLVSMAFGKC